MKALVIRERARERGMFELQGSRLLPKQFFESVRVKIWHGHTCASAWSALLQSARAASRSTL